MLLITNVYKLVNFLTQFCVKLNFKNMIRFILNSWDNSYLFSHNYDYIPYTTISIKSKYYNLDSPQKKNNLDSPEANGANLFFLRLMW